MADPELISSDKSVATAMLLRFRNNETGQCNPSFRTVAKVIGMSRDTVMDAVARLEAAGYVTVSGTKGGAAANTNQFEFHLKQTGGAPTTRGEHDTGGVVISTGVAGKPPKGWSGLHTNYLLNQLELILVIRSKRTGRIAR